MSLTNLFQNKNNTPFEGFASDNSHVAPGVGDIIKPSMPTIALISLCPREMQRFDFEHFLLRQVLKANYRAPIGPQPQHILDISGGTGRWGQEMALQFPHASVITYSIVPGHQLPLPGIGPNHLFQVADSLTTLPFPDAAFNFTHERQLVAFVPEATWPILLREMTRVTCPGGWIELLESNDSFHHIGPQMHHILSLGRMLLPKLGFSMSFVQHFRDYLRELGLHNIRMQAFEMPIGSWMGDLRRTGMLVQQNIFSGMKSLSNLYCQAGALSEHEFAVMLQALPREWENYHTTYSWFSVCAQR